MPTTLAAIILSLSLVACDKSDEGDSDTEALYDGDGTDGIDGADGTGGTDGSADDCMDGAEDCDTIGACFSTRTQAARSCSDADECGQEMIGTSCGCTNNWVARSDADLTDFYEALEDGQALECDWAGLASTCDCPEVDGFVCDGGTCGWNYTP